jgi:D-serine deaminase-like pyridoxal phosphate-dependent protein
LTFLDNIKQPALILDERKCRSNIHRMVEKAQKQGLFFRPHFKTHQSKMIGEWFRGEGVTAITVSSVSMARYFAEAGWNDITIAFPLNILEKQEIDDLSKTISLNILVSSAKVLAGFDEIPLGVFIKIDCGYHRAGISVERFDEIEDILAFCRNSSALQFRGFLTHSGNTYQASTPQEVNLIHEHARNHMAGLKVRYLGTFPDLVISTGDTPSCSIAGDFTGISEIRPGNFVFYDLMQAMIGSCNPDDIAVALACPVVETHPDRNEVIIYGGAIHLSKESCLDRKGTPVFGQVVMLSESGWGEPLPDCFVKSLSQEHGVVYLPDRYTDYFKPGSIAGILPVHSCLTAQAMRGYSGLSGQLFDHI